MRHPAVFRARRRRARFPALISGLALVTALAACSDGDSDSDDDGGSEDEVAALTEDQAAEAVLQEDNLGPDWSAEPVTEDDDTTAGPGCFADIDTLTEGLTKVTSVGTEFTYSVGVPIVKSTATAYDEEIAVAAVFDQVQTVLEACTTIDGPDGDGNEWDLAVETSDEQTYDAEDQFSLSASGTFTQAGGDESPIYLEWTSARVGPNVATVTTLDTESRADEHAALAQVAVDRMNAVIDGEEPAATTVPAPA